MRITLLLPLLSLLTVSAIRQDLSCPGTPNCVSTEATTESQRMAAIPFRDSPEAAQARARAALLAEARTVIVAEEPGVLRAEATSRIFRFVDDVVVVIDADARVFRFRSASRVGKSDLGVNRKRMTRVAARLAVTP
jgi:uncharacterized protein (DUF1499 family)